MRLTGFRLHTLYIENNVAFLILSVPVWILNTEKKVNTSFLYWTVTSGSFSGASSIVLRRSSVLILLGVLFATYFTKCDAPYTPADTTAAPNMKYPTFNQSEVDRLSFNALDSSIFRLSNNVFSS